MTILRKMMSLKFNFYGFQRFRGDLGNNEVYWGWKWFMAQFSSSCNFKAHAALIFESKVVFFQLAVNMGTTVCISDLFDKSTPVKPMIFS